MTFDRDGFEIFADVLGSAEIDSLIAVLPTASAGLRNTLWQNTTVRAIAVSPKIGALLTSLGARGARAVRAIFFDKNAAKNWGVPWHQDIAIAVVERREAPGFQGWSVKDGVPHVHPPTQLLERMITLRIHLDDCDASNGALRVVPGSHRHGILSDKEIERRVQEREFTCEVRRGGVIAMRPLLLHASSRAKAPVHRRVLHLEYSADALPAGLAWFHEVSIADLST